MSTCPESCISLSSSNVGCDGLGCNPLSNCILCYGGDVEVLNVTSGLYQPSGRCRPEYLLHSERCEVNAVTVTIFVVLPVVIAAAVIAGIAYWYYRRRQNDHSVATRSLVTMPEPDTLHTRLVAVLPAVPPDILRLIVQYSETVIRALLCPVCSKYAYASAGTRPPSVGVSNSESQTATCACGQTLPIPLRYWEPISRRERVECETEFGGELILVHLSIPVQLPDVYCVACGEATAPPTRGARLFPCRNCNRSIGVRPYDAPRIQNTLLPSEIAAVNAFVSARKSITAPPPQPQPGTETGSTSAGTSGGGGSGGSGGGGGEHGPSTAMSGGVTGGVVVHSNSGITIELIDTPNIPIAATAVAAPATSGTTSSVGDRKSVSNSSAVSRSISPYQQMMRMESARRVSNPPPPAPTPAAPAPAPVPPPHQPTIFEADIPISITHS